MGHGLRSVAEIVNDGAAEEGMVRKRAVKESRMEASMVWGRVEGFIAQGRVCGGHNCRITDGRLPMADPKSEGTICSLCVIVCSRAQIFSATAKELIACNFQRAACNVFRSALVGALPPWVPGWFHWLSTPVTRIWRLYRDLLAVMNNVWRSRPPKQTLAVQGSATSMCSICLPAELNTVTPLPVR